ncbi:MAG TPA: NADH-quinone oxidoreductase subunit L, partial [Thermoguttaceae bacterium]|nr:NADH-quinone oxidoreductase subunit L [Thermoguttaceae bacterium]
SAIVSQPPEHLIHGHEIHVSAGWTAFTAALIGFGFATLFYGVRKLDAEDARKTFAPIHRFLLNKWWFDELYEFLFIRPVMRISGWITMIDKRGLDWLADSAARLVRIIARIDSSIDRIFVDGLIDLTARWTHAVGLKLRAVQTGSLRQYVMFIALGVVVLFILISQYWGIAVAGP